MHCFACVSFAASGWRKTRAATRDSSLASLPPALGCAALLTGDVTSGAHLTAAAAAGAPEEALEQARRDVLQLLNFPEGTAVRLHLLRCLKPFQEDWAAVFPPQRASPWRLAYSRHCKPQRTTPAGPPRKASRRAGWQQELPCSWGLLAARVGRCCSLLA